jgi:hypothetical protein
VPFVPQQVVRPHPTPRLLSDSIGWDTQRMPIHLRTFDVINQESTLRWVLSSRPGISIPSSGGESSTIVYLVCIFEQSGRMRWSSPPKFSSIWTGFRGSGTTVAVNRIDHTQLLCRGLAGRCRGSDCSIFSSARHNERRPCFVILAPLYKRSVNTLQRSLKGYELPKKPAWADAARSIH